MGGMAKAKIEIATPPARNDRLHTGVKVEKEEKGVVDINGISSQ
jgi:hypothetical protein